MKMKKAGLDKMKLRPSPVLQARTRMTFRVVPHLDSAHALERGLNGGR